MVLLESYNLVSTTGTWWDASHDRECSNEWLQTMLNGLSKKEVETGCPLSQEMDQEELFLKNSHQRV